MTDRNPQTGLADACHGLEVRFPPGMPDPVQRLMAVLGVRVVFDDRVDGTYEARADQIPKGRT